MNFNEYQDWTDSTAIYPEANTASPIELVYLALGLGESGEVQGKVKKLIRDQAFDAKDIAKELGDITWYIARLAKAVGYTFEDIITMNVNKLEDRKDRGKLKGSGDER